MITSWSYGINALPQFKHGDIYLREEPWWLALCGWAIDKMGYGCRLLHWIQFPGIVRFKSLWPEQGAMTLKEYYGDLGEVYHCLVYQPLFYWHHGHPKSKTWDVELGYGKVKELFGERDKEFFAEQESHSVMEESA